MSIKWLIVLAALACSSAPNGSLSRSQVESIRGEIERAMRDAYDLTKPNAADRMLSLYPASGPVISASGGRIVTSRDTLEIGIRYFWNSVGVNMRSPQWVWDRFYIDVLSPTAAVATATYRVPHRDPQNRPHLLGGAMTAVFEKRDGKWVIVQEHLSDLPTTPDSIPATAPTHQP
jgi:hypothetical protein